MNNQTRVTEFIFSGFSNNPQIEMLLFTVFLLIYLITLFGNFTIIMTIRMNAHLHTPMYVLLSCLGCLDLAFPSVTVPKMLQNLLAEKKSISVQSCVTQVFFGMGLIAEEGLLLSVMAYDRFIAISHPLHYTVVMSKPVVAQLLCATLTTSFLYSLLNTLLLFRLRFCGSNVIHHFCCEPPQLFRLSCINPLTNHMVIFTLGSLIAAITLLITFGSYVRIISAVLRISSAEGKRKAFSTCSSHLTVVVLYYGTLFFRYLKPTSQDFQEQEMAPSVIYFILTPMLNPIIYSLRNQEVKKGLHNIIVRKWKHDNI